MGKLVEALGAPDKKRIVVRDCVSLIDEEVADKGGLTGLAVKAAYRTVKGLRPDFIERAVEAMLPDFAKNLEPLWDRRAAEAPSEPMDRYLSRHAAQAADALLSVSDVRAARSDKGIVRATYERLRPTGKRHVEEAMPRLGRLLDRHVK